MPTLPSRPPRRAPAPRRLRPTPLVAALAALLPLASLAAGPVVPPPPPPPNAVPVPGATWRTYGAGTAGPINVNNARGGVDQTVAQSSQKAIYNWQSFDIGSASSVNFQMALPGSSALNRVTGSATPSQIFGTLSATNGGEIYLINANGILFGKTAVVNTGSLIASGLDVTDANFEASLVPSLTATDNTTAAAFAYTGDPANFVDSKNFVQVAPGAQITTASGGRVFLFAKNVDNAGTITTPDGQTALAAGSEVFLRLPDTRDIYAAEDNPNLPVLRGLLVEVGDTYAGNSAVAADAHLGTVTNEIQGTISVPRGNATLVGMAVNQLGRISATTSVSENGSIFLRAQGDAGVYTQSTSDPVVPTAGGTLTLGPDSQTQILPDTALVNGAPPTSTDAAGFVASRIDLLGKTVELQSGASVVAPGATVNVRAESAPQLEFSQTGPSDPNARVLIDPGATIDVSGTTDATASVDRWFVTTQLLTSSDLADAPLQKDGILYRSTATIDVRQDSLILGDLSRYRDAIGRTVDERLSSGGTVNLVAQGAVLLAPGSTIDVSGGRMQFASAMVDPTQLVSSTGALYTLNDAPADLVYALGLNLGNANATQYDRWGAIATPGMTTPAYLEPGYLQGQAAGAINIDAPTAILQGTLAANTVAGARQLAGLDPRAALGRLSLGDSTGFDKFDGALLAGQPTLLQNFSIDAAGPAPGGAFWQAALNSTLPPDSGVALATLAQAGFGEVSVSAQQDVSMDAGAAFALPDHGALTLQSAQGDVALAGNVGAHDGSVTLQAQLGAATLAAGAQVDLSGRWFNAPLAGVPADTSATAGGSFVAEGERGVTTGTGSTIDVSGGAALSASGALAGGNAGRISLLAGRTDRNDTAADPADQRLLRLEGTLRGDALAGAAGGALALRAPSIEIGTPAAGSDPAALQVDAGFFTRGGFSSYTLDGLAFLDVAPGTAIAPTRDVFYPASSDFRLAPTGSAVGAVLALGQAPGTLPATVNLALKSSGVADETPAFQDGGAVTLGAGSAIDLVPGSSFSAAGAVSVDAAGRIVDHGGNVALGAAGAGTPTAASYVWIADGASIDVSGTTLVTPSTDGLAHGSVQDGGNVTLAAGGNANNLGASVVVQDGARLDLDGSVGTVAVTQLTANGTVATPRTLASHGGNLAISATGDLMLEGTVSTRGGDAQAAGGAIAVSLLGARDDFTFSTLTPATVPALTLVADATHATDALTPAALPTPTQIAAANDAGSSGAAVSASWVQASGAADLSLGAPRQLHVAGDVTLALPGNLTLNAQALVVDDGRSSALAGATTTLGNTAAYVDPNGVATKNVPPLAAGAGTGRLAISGTDLVVDGNLVTQQAGTLTLAATGDLQLRSSLATDAGVGTLAVAGDLALSAGQVYPATGQQYTISAPGHQVTIGGGDASLPKPLSAGGALTVDAATIAQDGVVRAPFGSIALDATTSLALGDGSETSVSGAGLTVSYGSTSNGATTWIGAGASIAAPAITALPGKTLALTAPSVSTAAGATVDLAGGGTVVGYEFVPGPGGSTDVFAGGDGAYAIVPGTHGLAPYDPGFAGAAPTGEQIVIGAGAPLPAGAYTLLPARYALLPGAFLVTPVAGTPLAQGTAIRNPDGSVLVGASTALANTGFTSATSSTWRVQTSAQAQAYSQILATSADAFFAAQAQSGNVAAPRGAADGGVLQVAAGTADIAGKFDFQGAVDAAGKPAGLGGVAAFSADHIVVAEAGAPRAADTLTLSAQQLDAMAPATLLLGATVGAAGTQGTTLNVVAQSVTFANTATPLAADDVIAAASGSVNVQAGASIAANAPSAASDAPASFQIAGDGAALRVANATGADMTRGSAPGATGALTIGAGARLDAGAGSLVLDGTQSNVIAGDATLHAADITLAAGAVQVGNAPATGALVLNDALLAQVNDASHLTLRGYNAIAFLADTQLGGNALDAITLDTGRLLSAAGDASVDAGQIALANTTGTSQQHGGTGTGTLTLHADAGHGSGLLLLGDGTIAVNGTQDLALRADGALVLAGDSTLSAGGAVLVQTPRVIAQAPTSGATSVADATLNAAGDVRFAGAGTAAGPAPSTGAALAVNAASIEQGTDIELPSGQLALTATHGDVSFMAGSRTDLAGSTRTIDGTPVSTGGGSVAANAAAGNVTLAAGASLDVSAAGTAPGGSASFSAPQGAVALAGTLTGTASDPGFGAQLAIDASTTPGLAALVALQQQAQTNFDGSVDLRHRGTGNLLLAAGSTLAAQSVTLENDGGALAIAGTVDASGAAGGSIDLSARGNLTLAAGGTLTVHATGTAAPGGSIALTTTDGTLALSAGSNVDLRSDAAARDADVPGGRLTLRAARTGITSTNPGGTDVAIAPIGAAVQGAAAVDVQAVQGYDGVTSITNDPTVTAPGTLQTATLTANDTAFLGTGGANTDAIASRLAGGNASLDALLRIHPESQIRSTGNLTIATNNQAAPATDSDDWVLEPFSTDDATTSSHAGDQSVTLLAAGNVTVPRTISAGFAAVDYDWGDERDAPATSTHAGNIRIVAGAVLGAADAMRTGAAGGTLTVARTDQAKVPNGAYDIVALRSTTGDVSLAAAGDIDMRANGSHALVYTLGADATDPVAAAIRANIADDQSSFAFDSGAGDVSLRAGGSVVAADIWQLQYSYPQSQEFANLRAGIAQVGGVPLAGGGTANADAWSLQLLAFDNSSSMLNGVFSLGGGRVSVAAGQDVVNVEAMSPSTGYVLQDAGGATTATRVFGGGDVSVSAGRDIVNGVFESGGQTMRLAAGRDIAWRTGAAATMGEPGTRMLVEDGALVATARRDATFGYVQDAFTSQDQTLTGLSGDASASVQAAGGNASMLMTTESDASTLEQVTTIYAPARFSLTAPWGDLHVGDAVGLGLGQSSLAQMPVWQSRFDLLAGGDVVFDPASAFLLTLQGTPDLSQGPQFFQGIQNGIPATGLDQSDRTPVHIASADGDATLTQVTSARPVRIAAGEDVTLLGQLEVTQQPGTTAEGAQTAGETSSIQAGRDVVLAPEYARFSTGPIDIAGPGEFLVLAGRDVNLGSGTSGDYEQYESGIVATGNARNGLLPAAAANVTVVAGLRADGADYLQALHMGFDVLGASGLTDHAGDLYALLAAGGTGVVALGSAPAQAFSALGPADQLAKVQALVGTGFYDAQLAAYVRAQPGESGLTDAQAIAAFAGLSAAKQAAAPGVILAQSFAGRTQAQRDGFIGELAAAGNPAYAAGLVAYLQRLQGRTLTLDQAIAAFEALPLMQQVPLLDSVLVAEVRADGRAAAAASGAAQEAAYDAGYRAIAELFPADRPAGDIDMPEATVKTTQSASITLLAPGGGVNAGGVEASSVSPDHLGVITVAGGDISSIVQNDFLVNQSRVFTLAPGDLLIWSSDGDIDAGRGAKSAVGAPAPVLRLDPNTGLLFLDTSGSFTGSGIAVLDPASTLDLYAPAGAIDAGEAGIKAAGNAFFAAQTFLGTDNLQVGGHSVGAPPPVTGGGTAALSTAGDAVAAGAASVAADQQEERRKHRLRRNLLLEFLGFGPGN